jgi:hypothetical protein
VQVLVVAFFSRSTTQVIHSDLMLAALGEEHSWWHQNVAAASKAGIGQHSEVK